MDELQKMVSGKEYFINDVELKKIRKKLDTRSHITTR